MGEVEHAVDGAEEPCMARGAAERIGVLVMHLAPDHAPAPSAALGCGAERRVGPEGELFRQRLIDERLSGDALDGDAEQHEVDVGIDRRPALPDALQDERAQGLGILAVGVERLDAGQMRLMRQALPEGEAPLGGVHVVLAQVRDDLYERIVERNRSRLDQA